MNMTHCDAYESGCVGKLDSEKEAHLKYGDQLYESVKPVDDYTMYEKRCALQPCANLDDRGLKDGGQRYNDVVISGSEPIYSKIT